MYFVDAQLEIGAVKRQLIACTTAPTVRKLLVKLAKVAAESNQTQQLEPWHINPSWMLPISIKTILMSLQRGFFQDFAYTLIAKSKEMIARNVCGYSCQIPLCSLYLLHITSIPL